MTHREIYSPIVNNGINPFIIDQHNTGHKKKPQRRHQLRKIPLTAVLLLFFFSSPVLAADLNIHQHVTAAQMRETVLMKAITQRIAEMCADFTADDAKLNARRDLIMTAAKSQFASGQEFMNAAGINEKAKTGEELRRFFLDRGVKWESSPKEYCELANALTTVNAPVSEYLIKRK